MKIGIDTQTTLGQKTGFGFYVENLVKELKKIDKKNQYFYFHPKKQEDLSSLERFKWDQFELVKKANNANVDILHQPCFSAPIFFSGVKIVTIHDLITLNIPQKIPFFSRQFFGKWMPYSYKFADRIIAISEHTKKDIIKFLNIAENKISVIPQAASKEFNTNIKNEAVEKVRKKYKIGKKYFLHTGTLNPRKNLEFLVGVFSEVSKKFPDYQLVIVGKKGWYYEGLFDLVRQLKIQEKVIFTGYIDDCDAPPLYKGAKAFLFPSIYEGFGLPPLEAMNCGIPVVSSNASSLPEVIGPQGILLDPNDKKVWVANILKLISDQSYYQKMSDYYLRQAKNFSWEKCAQKTIEVYSKAYKEKRR